jgi:dihydrodipicolinate synthase/N-acetylneuraminate lyase
MKVTDIPVNIRKVVKNGIVIPAMPLVLTADRGIDEIRQKALIRYYIDAGAGGLAAGVHTTQFEIRDSKYNLYQPLLSLASKTIDEFCAIRGRDILKVAGICGRTRQAIREAEFSRKLGFHAGLLSMAAFAEESIETMINFCEEVSQVIPLFGFYLQPAVGGRILSHHFWLKFCSISNVLGIKIAPFNRYFTFDVVRAVCETDRENDIALYTGNDDNIVADLLTTYRIKTAAGEKKVRIVGGLLGHWSVWTKKAVELLDEIHSIVAESKPVPQELLTRGQQITDANAVIFDAANNFAGCIPGIHEILRRQGLLSNILCLNPKEKLSENQAEEIDRIWSAYPHLNDDDFVKAHLPEWLGF